ncbi:MAG TPA: UDP-N-acetylmuramoyl-L-alanyl-D-glutamate--2,6-diaminopimelate ligase [Candidatus Acidoferrales bacterium]|nr:UDP-N-acetylmuramoyl-L-alanyl-D-glutamate--2,6-diaminopimelate ligase [Candidatus Acidoferrales bacterium]
MERRRHHALEPARLVAMRLAEFLTLDEVAEAQGDLDQEVTGLAYDSRKVHPGQVFFAVPGVKVDGHDFVPAALERGAVGVVIEREIGLPAGTTWVRVKDVRRAMGLWSAYFFERPSDRLILIGVTGTNGKTTVTYLLESILATAGLSPGVIGTVNYRYKGHEAPSHHTTPESLDLQSLLADMRQAGVESVAMEVSSHALVQERVRGLQFDMALFTNLSRDHLDYHTDMDDYFAAKSRLFTDHLAHSVKARKAAVIHGHDSWGKDLLKRTRDLGLDTWSYGKEDDWDVHPGRIENNVGGVRGELMVKQKRYDFSSTLVGAANLENILGAVAAGFALGLPSEAIFRGLEKLKSVPGRLEKVNNNLGVTILVDYAHTPDALDKVLSAVRPLTQKRLITVFGCGGDRDRGKRPLMGEIAAKHSDLVVLTSDNPRTEDPLKILDEIEAGVRKTRLKKCQVSSVESEVSQPETRNPKPETNRGYCVEADRREAIRVALRWAQAGDLVLIAGKGHEDYQILGPRRIHFDDREVAREEASRRADA